MRAITVAMCLSLFTKALFAEEAAPDPSVLNPDEPVAREMRAAMSASYFGPFSNRSDPLANLNLSFAAPFGEEDTLTINQGFTKFFYLEGERGEYEAADTLIGFSRKTSIQSFEAAVQFDLTLPTSKFSQAQGIYSKPRFSLSTSGPGWNERLSWQAALFARYHVNKFKTTRFETGSGGDPLPWMQYGGSAGLGYILRENWSLSLSAAYSEIQYERDTGLEHIASYERMADHPYSVDAALTYRITQKLTATLGYSNGSQVEAFGGTDFVIFDDQLSVWYVSSTVTF